MCYSFRMAEDYDIDGFKTLTLRACRGSRAAVCEGLRDLHFGDSLTVVVTGVAGCVPAALVFGVYGPDSELLSAVGAGGWAFVPGSTDAVYASVSVDADPAAVNLANTLAPGVPVEVRLYLYETGGRTWIDSAIDFYPNPAVAGGTAGAANSFVTRAQLAALADSVLAMPALTAYQKEQRFLTLLNGLAALA